MNSAKHLITAIILSLSIVVLGTLGYVVIEGWPLLDALYMTVITLTTVGYGEIHTISHVGRIYTIGLIVVGVAFTLYVAGAAVQFMVEGRIRSVLGRRRLDRKIDRVKDHYIICGYGRIGRVLAGKLLKKGLDLVIVEKSEPLVQAMEEDKVLYIVGEASSEANLQRAGIERAKGLVAALGTDTENVFLVLTARQLNPDIFIIARASLRESKAKLRAAGANRVESPYEMGAIQMAQRIINPTVTSFLELAFTDQRRDIQMEEIPVNERSDLKDVRLADSGIRQRFNLIIIAIKKPNGDMRFNPSHETTIHPGDTVIAVGEADNLIGLKNALDPP